MDNVFPFNYWHIQTCHCSFSNDAPLPPAVASGAEPFFVIGAIAGG